MAWKPPRSAEMISRVRFERRGAAANVGGVVKSAFAPFLEQVPARLLPLRGGEQLQAQRMEGVSRFELTLLADDETELVTTDDRAVDEVSDQAFDIRFCEVFDVQGRWIVMQLEKGAGDGRQGA